ncbi:MAG: hypothetical protein PHO32_09520 [Candidatus Cloacimonetes bacterium]|nr:hypothetical protein [Candidatus Cloacimonadota bacterium]
MLSFNRDTLHEYRCGLGCNQAHKLQPTYSRKYSCHDSGAACSFCCRTGVLFVNTNGGSSE